jgi:serine/threonine protein kinase
MNLAFALDGRYEEDGVELGKGAFGTVARTKCGRAIKWIKGCANEDDRFHAREIDALDACRHSNVVPMLDHGYHDGDLYVVMELWTCTLADQMRRAPFTLPQGNWILANVLRGLTHIHACGYIHRDLKPANILLRHEAVCIADFGHAAPFPQRNEVLTVQQPLPTQSDKVFTRWYRPPEVALLLPYEKSADIFSVGCVFVEIVRHALGRAPHALFNRSVCCFPLSGDDLAACEHLFVMWQTLGTPTPAERETMNRPSVRVAEKKRLLAYLDALPIYKRLELDFPVMQTAWTYAMLAYDPAVRISAESMLQWIDP